MAFEKTGQKYCVVQKFTGILCAGEWMCRNRRLGISRCGSLGKQRPQVVGLRSMNNRSATLDLVKRNLPDPFRSSGPQSW